MMTLQRLKYYLIAGADLIILQIHRFDFFDESIKRGSLIVGFLVGIVTLIKFIQDIIKNSKDNKLKDLEIRRKEEETRRFFEQKYSDK
jgi:hypothetical protein